MLSCRVLAVQTQPDTRRNILADLLTVYANAGKTIVFTQTKREADEVAAGIAGVIPSEVLSLHCSVCILCVKATLTACQYIWSVYCNLNVPRYFTYRSSGVFTTLGQCGVHFSNCSLCFWTIFSK